MVAIILETDANTVTHALRQIKSLPRNQVTEITLDLSESMNRICGMVFPKPNGDRPFPCTETRAGGRSEDARPTRRDAIQADTDAREET